MITNFFIPELSNHDVQELWFQQDGATCHTARATIDLLKDTFGDRLISRFGPVNWPPRSCDLTPLDFFSTRGLLATDHVSLNHGQVTWTTPELAPPSDSRPEGMGSMPPNTLQVHSEYVLVKSVDPKVLWAESRVQGTGEYFPPIQFNA
ncbi:uncharacterized protein TNCV_3102151 [Trichonephila clavipes]|nr:uncharacterized protein TNCV_3102151 [Trichonephila clavipes]